MRQDIQGLVSAGRQMECDLIRHKHHATIGPPAARDPLLRAQQMTIAKLTNQADTGVWPVAMRVLGLSARAGSSC